MVDKSPPARLQAEGWYRNSRTQCNVKPLVAATLWISYMNRNAFCHSRGCCVVTYLHRRFTLCFAQIIKLLANNTSVMFFVHQYVNDSNNCIHNADLLIIIVTCCVIHRLRRAHNRGVSCFPGMERDRATFKWPFWIPVVGRHTQRWEVKLMSPSLS